MADPARSFADLVRPVLERALRQSGHAVPTAAQALLVERLWALVAARGVPPPLPPGEKGEPGEMPAAVVAEWVEPLLAGFAAADRDALATPARQLVKACFQGDFKACRESYHELSPDGSCRRQELPRVRERISGSHCVDCPYWLNLTPMQHERLLTKAWHGGAAALAAHRDVFLPGDFRALRQFIRTVVGRNRS
ncbi:MAG: hypothetical protein KF897_16045 [Opitutaceae bacterium]|nr:hypothetical protein [Opitutaceae bacterium]